MTLAWRSRIEKIMDGPIEISYQQYTSPFVELDSHYEEWVQSLFQALRVPPEYLFPNRPNQ